MKTSQQSDATTTPATPLSPHRRASIHRMRDRYKSQLMAEKKKVEVVARYDEFRITFSFFAVKMDKMKSIQHFMLNHVLF